VTVEGYARFYLLELNPDVKLYLQPISFHPKTLTVSHGPVRISTPQSFAGDLYDKYGSFKTIGWASDTWALNELRIPEDVFLEDVWRFVGQYRQMMMDFLKSDEPLYVHVYSFTDRIAHMFWHHLDEGHPLYKPELAAKYAPIVQKAYVLMDDIVGDVLKAMSPDMKLFVLSDHGFHSFRYGFNVNTWLAQNGYIVSKNGSLAGGKQMKLEDLFGKKDFWTNVDWSKTQAYALGLGALYINVAGRESGGIVPPSGRAALCAQIIKGLESYVDPKTGLKPVFKCYTRESLYTGFLPNQMPDLRVANSEYYRTGWQSTLGGIPPDICDVNGKKWSGDHCSFEPSITKGIFFSSIQMPSNVQPHLMDFFPTIVKLFGYDVPGDIDGKSLV
jgi:predicted AlkP superfamily phosphohydrolase/phosphomutase